MRIGNVTDYSPDTRQMSRGARSVRDFLDWWGRELAAACPEFLRRLVAKPVRYAFYRQDGAKLVRTGAASAGRRLLLLDRDEALVRMVVLPKSAQRRLREILDLQLVTDTPFSREEVVDDFVIRATHGAKIEVEHVIVKRAIIENVKQRAQDNSWRIAGVDVAAQGNAEYGMGVNLAPELAPEGRLGVLANKLSLMLIVLIILAAATALFRLDRTARAYERELDDIRPRVAAVMDLRGELDASTDMAAYLGARLAREASFSELLEELTTAMPDEAWLEQLQWDGEAVTLTGLAAEASSIPPLIEAAPRFSQARMISAVTIDRRTDRERFRIRALSVDTPTHLAAEGGAQ